MNAEITPEESPSRRQKVSASLRHIAPVLKEFAVNVLAQVRIWRAAYPGLMHALIFWGVTVQVLGTAINLMQMQLFVPFVALSFPRLGAYLVFELIMDIAGLAILAGVAMAAFRRGVLRPKTLETRFEDLYALGLLFLIPLVGFSLEGLRLASVSPAWAPWSPLGSIFARSFAALGLTPAAAAQLHPFLFWTHVGLGLALVASIPFTKLRHLVQTPLNILLRPRRESAVLEVIENIEEAEILGVGRITEFTPVQLLSFDACVRCGRCEQACPSVISGMAFSPKNFIQSLRDARVAVLEHPNGGAKQLIGEIIPEHSFWTCTTCGACLSRCPGFVNPVDEVIDLRRYQTLTTGQVPKSVADALRNIERAGNPWGLPPESRLEFLDELGIRQLEPGDETGVLLFLGCAATLDERSKKVTRAFVSLLRKAGVDFAALAVDETCCGETARRLGHEYLFQVFAEQNIEAMSQVRFERIITQCPHCFNTLKNEYPQFGAGFDVLHAAEFLDELGLSLAERPDQNGGAVVYHDPCYLGRHNQVYDPPRRLLRQGVNLVEMDRARLDSLCCGGGGGQMWMETDAETRINHRRLEDALETGAGTIATACPYCLLMFDDAIRSKGIGDHVQVLDISEVLEPQLAVREELT